MGKWYTSDDDNDDDGEEYSELSALQWFAQCEPETLLTHGNATVIVQRPGEVVFLPAGWWHVVLNVEQSTATSSSLALRRDIPSLLPELLAEDEAFAQYWFSTLRDDPDYAEVLASIDKSALE